MEKINTNYELEKSRLNFSRCRILDVATKLLYGFFSVLS